MPVKTIHIKNAIEHDVPQILTMIREFAKFENLLEFCEVTEEKLREAMFGDNPCIEGIMAFDETNKAAGYALFYPNFASFRGQRGVYLEDLYVIPEMRLNGVGLALMKHLAKLAKLRGCERMDWQVLTWNQPAIKFYHKLGASQDSDERHFRLAGPDFERLANANG